MFRTPLDRPYLRNKQARRILDAARDVFIADGGAAFSARAVAKAARLSLGSVQHVFPTIDALLTAMLEHVHDEYEAAYAAMTERLPYNAAARLRAALDFLLGDVCRRERRRFWIGFWALANHNAHAHRLLKRTYQHHTRRVAAYLSAARAELSEGECLHRATHIIALIEGMILMAEAAEKPPTPRSPLIKHAQAAIEIITNAPERASS